MLLKIDRFDSVESYAEQVVKVESKFRAYGYGGASRGPSWDGGLSYRESVDRSIKGDPTVVSKYTSMVDKLVDNYQINQEQRAKYVPSVAGSRVSVPDYLASSPFCMRRRAKVDVQVQSVNLFVSTTCAAGIDTDMMIKRGSTIMALLEYLQLTQISVELFLLAETDGATTGDHIQVIKVQSHPLNLSTAGFAIAHPAFARHLTYPMACVLDGSDGSSWGRLRGHGKAPDKFINALKKELPMQDGDIYIEAPNYFNDEILNSPETWLEKRIKSITNKGEN